MTLIMYTPISVCRVHAQLQSPTSWQKMSQTVSEAIAANFNRTRPQGTEPGRPITAGAVHRTTLTHGTMVAAVTDTSATVWFRVNAEATVQIECISDLEALLMSSPIRSSPVTVSAGDDYTGTAAFTGLAPDTVYNYRILVNGEDQTPIPYPRFKTFPTNAESVKIGILTDILRMNPAAAFSALAKDEPDFVIILGDYDHRDALNLAEMRNMHRGMRGEETVPGPDFRDKILQQYPVAQVWDDHDYAGNNSDKTFERKEEAIQAHREYWPSYPGPKPDQGIWHQFTYGNLVEVFMLDVRSQRDVNTHNDPRYHQYFKMYRKGEITLKQLDAERHWMRIDPWRSMLDGDNHPEGKSNGQLLWLLKGLENSTAKWKIIASPVPFNPTTAKHDSWWDFKYERNYIMNWIKGHNISGVMVISGDIHTGGAIDDGTHAGVPELNVPTTNVFGPDTTVTVNQPNRKREEGVWSHGFSSDGVGYGLITLAPALAFLEAKDEIGNTRLQCQIQAQ